MKHRIEAVRTIGVEGALTTSSDDLDGSQAKALVAAGAVPLLLCFLQLQAPAPQPAMRHHTMALKSLANIAEKGFQGKVGKTDGVLEALTACLVNNHSSMATNYIFALTHESKEALKELLEATTQLAFVLSENQDRDIRMVASNGLLQALVDIWQKADALDVLGAFMLPVSASRMIKDVISILANLSYNAGNRDKIAAAKITDEDILSKLLRFVDGCGEPEVRCRLENRTHAFEALSCLTCNKIVCGNIALSPHLDDIISNLTAIIGISGDLLLARYSSKILGNLIKSKQSWDAHLANPKLNKMDLGPEMHTFVDGNVQTEGFSVCYFVLGLLSMLLRDKAHKLRILETLSSIASCIQESMYASVMSSSTLGIPRNLK